VARIVSLTPSRVDRDSRTYKQAATFARVGHESLVVEALPSAVPPDGFPFRLLRAAADAPLASETPTEEEAGPRRDRNDRLPSALRAWRQVPRGGRRAVERLLHVPLTVAQYLRSAVVEARRLPAADLYWLHGYTQFPVVWLASRRHRVPFVYDVHDFYVQVITGGAGSAPERTLMRWFYLALEQACARTATELVTVSDGLAQLIEDRVGRRPHVVRNCVELRIEGHAGDLRAAISVGPDAFVVVVVGNHKLGMQATAAVRALGNLPEQVHLAFVGRGYERVVESAHALGVSDRVHVVGPVSSPDVPSFIRTADLAAVLYVGANSNQENSLPNGFFASIGAGLPMLYPGLREIRRLAERYQLGLVVSPANPDSLAVAIRALLGDPDRLAELRSSAERAGHELDWEHEEPRVLAVVDRLVQRGP
jgi:glycosyltransferase involved in cell wall biosynthesis